MSFKTLWTFIRYSIVGVIGTVIDLVLIYIFVEYFNFFIIPSAILSFLAAASSNFILNKLWTFENKSRNFKKLFIKFLIVSIFGLGLTVSLMFILVNLLEIWYIIAKVITSGAVLIWNFLGNKMWTFKIHEKKGSPYEKSLQYKFDLSIVIPAYNEENRIKKTLEIILKYMKKQKMNVEIIVVNDGSTDKTSEIIEEQAKKTKNLSQIRYLKNQGKGFAVKKGVLKSQGEYILFADADNSTPIEEFEKLLKPLADKEAEISIGSRYLKGSDVKIKQPYYRILIGRIGNVVTKLFFIKKIKDTQCGFKLFTNESAKKIFAMQKIKGFAFDVEILLIGEKLKYKIIEIPVSWLNSTESRIRPIRDSVKTLGELAFIKINDLSGRYLEEVA